MADDVEVVLVEPGATQDDPRVLQTTTTVSNSGTVSSVSTASAASVVDQLRQLATARFDTALVGTNLNRSLPAATPVLQGLPEFKEMGYSKNQPTEITCIKIGNIKVERYTGYDFLSMAAAALEAGLRLHINSGFRSYAEQAILYAERVNPDGTLTAAGKLKGIAGKPGNGPHQVGTALDIGVGMTVADLAAGRLSAKFIWLTENAIRWGFYRTVASEPWHWEHRGTGIVGPVATQDTLQRLVQASASSAAVAETSKPDGQLFLDRAAHDLSKAYERSVLMTRTTRKTLHAEMSRESILGGARVLGAATRYIRASAAVAAEPPVTTANTVKPATFDFNTGVWGDGERV